MLIIPLLFFGSIYWMIARCYVQIGKNVNHPSPGMAYFLIVPLVLPVYVAQLARVKGMKFGIVILLQEMMLLVGILSSQFTNKSIDRALEIQAEGRVVEQRIKADLGEDLSLQKLLEDPEFKSLNDELVEISTTKNPWRALSSILALLNLFYMSYLLLLATKMNMIHLLWNLIPLLGFFILFCLVYRASFHVTNDDEAVDPKLFLMICLIMRRK